MRNSIFFFIFFLVDFLKLLKIPTNLNALSCLNVNSALTNDVTYITVYKENALWFKHCSLCLKKKIVLLQ